MPTAKWGSCGQTAAPCCSAMAGQDCPSGAELTLQGGGWVEGPFFEGSRRSASSPFGPSTYMKQS